MGVADRDYMRDIPVYRDTVRTRGSWGLAGAAVVSLIVGGGLLLRSPLHLMHSGGRTTVLAPGHQTFPLGGPTEVRAGTVMTERGTLPPGIAGDVVVLARLNGGSWVELSRAQATGDGTYFVSFPLNAPGAVDLKLELPDGDQGVTRIAVTGASVGSATWPAIPGSTA
jgi:hypothetical protein